MGNQIGAKIVFRHEGLFLRSRNMEREPQSEGIIMSATKPAIFNEMLSGDDVRPSYQNLEKWYRSMPAELRSLKQSEAEALFRRVGDHLCPFMAKAGTPSG